MAGKLSIYDHQIDEWREPTQADLDRYLQIARAYGQLRAEMQRIQDELQTRLGKIKDNS